MYSQIWTHVASGELIEGCTLFGKRKTIIEDDVWLVGSCVVSSGLRLGRRSICLINSVVTKDTEQNNVYSGAPAKVMERVNFWKPVTLDEKFEMMFQWANDFVVNNSGISVKRTGNRIIELQNLDEKSSLLFVEAYTESDSKLETEFNMVEKTFKKKNTQLERDFYRFIYNHKARFIPLV
jgi:lysyl-tRNA synthetase class I